MTKKTHLNWSNAKSSTPSQEYFYNTPVGLLSIKVHANILLKTEWLTKIKNARPGHLPETILQPLNHYWQTAAMDFAVPLAIQGTHFQQKVWQALCHIPLGQTHTYGELAKELNTSPRALANACRCNPFPLIIPCHRIVAKTGLGGYAGQTSGTMTEIKRALLQHENKLTHEL